MKIREDLSLPEYAGEIYTNFKIIGKGIFEGCFDGYTNDGVSVIFQPNEIEEYWSEMENKDVDKVFDTLLSFLLKEGRFNMSYDIESYRDKVKEKVRSKCHQYTT